MRSENYRNYFKSSFMMGPNCIGATVYANDLWISEEENRKRFANWNMQDKLIPMQEDAADLHFNNV